MFSLFNNSVIWFDSCIIYNILLFFYSNIFNPFVNCFLFLTTGCNPDALLTTGLDVNPFPIFNFFIFLTPLITSTIIYYMYLFY